MVVRHSRGFEGQVRPRSGLALRSTASRCSIRPGTIDADYRGEVKVVLVNLGNEPFVVSPGRSHRAARVRAGRARRRSGLTALLDATDARRRRVRLDRTRTLN